jgi:hypothetical protein
MKHKYLVTSGCSFTDNCGLRWPHYLAKHTGLKLYNRGQGSSGNDYISRSTIHELTELLQHVDSGEIICIVMWSGIDRKSIFIKRNETPNFENLLNKRSFNFNPVNILNSISNQQATFGNESGYLLGSMNCTFENKNIQNYKKELIMNYYSDEALAIESYEHFLRLQWFCEVKGIKLLNLTYMNIMHYPVRKLMHNNIEPPLTKDVYSNIKHLFNLIDFSRWIFYESWYGLYEYVLVNNLTFGIDKVHPTEESHENYVQNFLLPLLTERNLL